MDWKPCLTKNHDWGQLADRVSYRCQTCGAAGYRRHVHNPFDGKAVASENVVEYSCPGCHGATKSPKSRCPNCDLRKTTNGWSPTVLQQEVLERLGQGGEPTSVSASGATLGVLRRRGLIKQVHLWQITRKGKEFLAGNSCNNEGTENG